MEQYVALKTFTDQQTVNTVCVALENSAVPVMIEHIECSHSEPQGVSFRLLVPFEFSQSARGVLGRIGISSEELDSSLNQAA
jgi:hypothetical protein